MPIVKLKNSLQAHWFMPLALAIVIADSILARSVQWQPARPLETGVILDMAVLLPILYAICYRRRGRAARARAAALACLGIWIAGNVIPVARHDLISHLSPLRYLGTAVLFLVELRLAIAIYRAAFASNPSETQRTLAAAEQAGVPQWDTRLMAWEAGLWRRAWQWLKQRSDRR